MVFNLWQPGWTFKFWCIFYVKRDYSMNQKRPEVPAQAALRGKKNGDCAARLKYAISILVALLGVLPYFSHTDGTLGC